MTFLKTATASVFCLALMGAVFSPAAKADEWNRKTKITFSGPVEIPGVHLKGWGVLPAGTYVFKIVDSLSDRHIVQIFNADETQVYATILAIPNYRLRATDKTVITFRERPAGQPEALRAWFYPGRNWGEEFVYPKAKAMELAKVTNTPVLYTTADLPLEVEQPMVAVRTGGSAVEAGAHSGHPTHGRRSGNRCGGHAAARRGTRAGHRADTGSDGETPGDGESVAVDRPARTPGAGRSLWPPVAAKARSVRGLVHCTARPFWRARRPAVEWARWPLER